MAAASLGTMVARETTLPRTVLEEELLWGPVPEETESEAAGDTQLAVPRQQPHPRLAHSLASPHVEDTLALRVAPFPGLQECERDSLEAIATLYDVAALREPASAVPAAPSQTEMTAQASLASALETTFQSLAERWRSDTRILSSVTAKAMHPDYQRIIGMGPAAVPLILRELQRRLDHWFWALKSITGEDPVAPEDAGDIERMKEAWLRFGQERSYL